MIDGSQIVLKKPKRRSVSRSKSRTTTESFQSCGSNVKDNRVISVGSSLPKPFLTRTRDQETTKLIKERDILINDLLISSEDEECEIFGDEICQTRPSKAKSSKVEGKHMRKQTTSSSKIPAEDVESRKDKEQSGKLTASSEVRLVPRTKLRKADLSPKSTKKKHLADSSVRVKPKKRKKIQDKNERKKKKVEKSAPIPHIRQSTTEKGLEFKIPKFVGLTKEELELQRKFPSHHQKIYSSNLTKEFKEKFLNIYDSIPALESSKSSTGVVTQRKKTLDSEEYAEMMDSGWNEVKILKSDKERLAKAQAKFGSKKSDPTRNLSFHGFKRRNGIQSRDISSEERSHVGVKNVKVTRLEEIVKKKMMNLFAEDHSRLPRQKEEQLKFYLGHVKKGQKEQLEFLKFYSSNKVSVAYFHYLLNSYLTLYEFIGFGR